MQHAGVKTKNNSKKTLFRSLYDSQDSYAENFCFIEAVKKYYSGKRLVTTILRQMVEP
jgi:hypothetical protein